MWTKTTPLLTKNGKKNKKKQAELEAKSPKRERGVASGTVKNCTDQQNDLLDITTFTDVVAQVCITAVNLFPNEGPPLTQRYRNPK